MDMLVAYDNKKYLDEGMIDSMFTVAENKNVFKYLRATRWLLIAFVLAVTGCTSQRAIPSSISETTLGTQEVAYGNNEIINIETVNSSQLVADVINTFNDMETVTISMVFTGSLKGEAICMLERPDTTYCHQKLPDEFSSIKVSEFFSQKDQVWIRNEGTGNTWLRISQASFKEGYIGLTSLEFIDEVIAIKETVIDNQPAYEVEVQLNPAPIMQLMVPDKELAAQLLNNADEVTAIGTIWVDKKTDLLFRDSVTITIHHQENSFTVNVSSVYVDFNKPLKLPNPAIEDEKNDSTRG